MRLWTGIVAAASRQSAPNCCHGQSIFNADSKLKQSGSILPFAFSWFYIKVKIFPFILPYDETIYANIYIWCKLRRTHFMPPNDMRKKKFCISKSIFWTTQICMLLLLPFFATYCCGVYHDDEDCWVRWYQWIWMLFSVKYSPCFYYICQDELTQNIMCYTTRN